MAVHVPLRLLSSFLIVRAKKLETFLDVAIMADDVGAVVWHRRSPGVLSLLTIGRQMVPRLRGADPNLKSGTSKINLDPFDGKALDFTLLPLGIILLRGQ